MKLLIADYVASFTFPSGIISHNLAGPSISFLSMGVYVFLLVNLELDRSP